MSGNSHILARTALLSLTVALLSFGQNGPPAGPETKPAVEAPSAKPSDIPPGTPKAQGTASGAEPVLPAQAALPDQKGLYILGPEDSIYIRVWHEPDLTGTMDIRPDGRITLPLIGEVKAATLTLAQLAATLHDKLLQYMNHPDVTVQLLRVNSKKFMILGEVNSPGTYPLTGPMTVLEALVAGHGFRDFANTKKIYLLRGTQKFNFNYKEVSKGKHPEENIQIQNGDQIFVP